MSETTLQSILTEQKYPSLFNEIVAINLAWHYGIIESLDYIKRHEEDYMNTKCYQEFRSFVKDELYTRFCTKV